MRTTLTVLLAFAAMSTAAVADPRNSSGRFGSFDFRNRPLPLTDADLDRNAAAAAPGPPSAFDEMVRKLGIQDGRAEIFSISAPVNRPPDAGLSGSLNGNGAQLRLRW